jgi:hypothetical protein
MKQTSLEAYADIQASGQLGKVQKLVYQSILMDGPATGREINQRLGGQGYHKRLSELKREGWIVEIEPRKCKVTGRKATVWALGHGVKPGKSNGKSRAEKVEATANQIINYINKRMREEKAKLVFMYGGDEPLLGVDAIEAIISRGMR